MAGAGRIAGAVLIGLGSVVLAAGFPYAAIAYGFAHDTGPAEFRGAMIPPALTVAAGLLLFGIAFRLGREPAGPRRP